MAGEYDLKIERSIVAGEEVYDLAFGPDGEPLFLAGARVIAQDVQNRILESGLAVRLVAIDGGAERTVLTALNLEAEEDLRLKPGSAASTIDASGKVITTAKLIGGGTIEAQA